LRVSALHRFYRPADPRWRHLFVEAELRVSPGIKVQLLATDFMHAEIAFTGSYDRELTKLVTTLAQRGGVLVDAGANIGYFSLIWANRNPANRAIAFEAAPHPGILLTRNVEGNGLAEQIIVHSIGLGAQTAVMHFDPGPDTLTGWGGLALSADANTIEVQVRRLDEVLPDAAIDLLKIDVEGADTWVLFGAERLLAEKRIKRIVYEQNQPRMQRLGIGGNAAAEFLTHLGYRTEPMKGRDKDVVNWQATPA
jgi:FkbM family methyltransferase